MNVTLTEQFEHEWGQMDIFQHNDLERFIERTKQGNPRGFARHAQLMGTPVGATDALLAVVYNGRAGAVCLWKEDSVTFTRAITIPEDPEEAPQWLKDL